MFFLKFLASYAFTFVLLFVLFGFARLVAMLAHRLLPDGWLKRKLFIDTGPL